MDREKKRPNILTVIKGWFQVRSTMDPQVYRVFSAGSGVVTILAVINFLPYIDPFFLPPYPSEYYRSWNFFGVIEHPIWTYLIFGVTFWAGVNMVRGIWVRRSAFCALLFMSGIITCARPLTSSSASVFCFVMLFLFLSPKKNEEGLYCGWAIFGLRFQLFLVYFCGVFFKLADPAWQQGFPLAGTLMGFSWSSHLGIWLSQLVPASWLNFVGQGVCGVEFVAPIAMFLFYGYAPARRAGVILLTMMHVGTALLMTLEFFPWVMVVVIMVFWDRKMVCWVAGLVKKSKRLAKLPFREVGALTAILVILLTAFGQVFFPAVGVEIPQVDQTVATLNRQVRFDQHWGMFTNTSFELNEESRASPRKTYRTTRLFVKTLDGELWDPFNGSASSLKTGLKEGASHRHSERKALSYMVKADGRWRLRNLQALSLWSVKRARQAGLNAAEVVVYRYAIPLDLSSSIKYEEVENVRARLWYRFRIERGEIVSSEEINPRSMKSVIIDFNED